VSAEIQNTKIIADHVVETKWGNEQTWKAEYVIGYMVDDHHYNRRVDSGVRGEDPEAVRLVLATRRPSCTVRYNPRLPAESLTNCE